MKIIQLLHGIHLPLTNEENIFVEKHKNKVILTSLNEHDHWVAQNLVRKGVYSVAEDHNVLIKN